MLKPGAIQPEQILKFGSKVQYYNNTESEEEKWGDISYYVILRRDNALVFGIRYYNIIQNFD
mgnify:CR=1 FL=1